MRLGITFGIAALITITALAPVRSQPIVGGQASPEPAELDENGNVPGSNAAARAKPFDRMTVFGSDNANVPEDIRNAANGIFGAWSGQQGAKQEWIAKQMEKRRKQESQ